MNWCRWRHINHGISEIMCHHHAPGIARTNGPCLQISPRRACRRERGRDGSDKLPENRAPFEWKWILRVVILSVDHAINLPHSPHKLFNPIQMRLNDFVVNETPKFQCANPTNLSHTITVKGDNMNDELIIPLDLRGVVSCFTNKKPTQEEFDTCDRYELTYESPVYDPSGSSYSEQEAAMMDSRGKLKVAEYKHPLRRQICPVHMAETFSDTTLKLQALSLTLDNISLLQEMTRHVHIS
jgi:hypothetical protein